MAFISSIPKTLRVVFGNCCSNSDPGQYVSDLQDLAQKWGNAFSKHYGTTCRWVDLHATRLEMAQYQQYKIAAKVTNVRYKRSGTAIDMPGVVVTDTTINDTSLVQKSIFKHTKSTTSTFTWTVKETISIGFSLTFTVGVPPECSSTATITANISVDSTQSDTKTEKEDWEIDRNVAVPPHTEVDMTWTINEKQSSATFHAYIILTGYIAIWNDDKIDINNPGGGDRHWLWFIPIDEAFNQMKDWGVSVSSLYTIGSGSVTYRASGNCTGVSGFNTTFQLKQTPRTKNEKSSKPAPPRTITEIGIPATNTQVYCSS